MYAVIETGGKQYRVEQGDTIEVEKIAGSPGDEVSFEKVLLIKEGKDVAVGQPNIAGSKVVGELVRHDRGEKIIVGKFKRRKKYRRKTGHRQALSIIQIKDIIQPQKEQSDGS